MKRQVQQSMEVHHVDYIKTSVGQGLLVEVNMHTVTSIGTLLSTLCW